MAVKLRLQRFGSTKRPVYRIVASDSRAKRDGRFLDIIGLYDPRQNPIQLDLDESKALAWLEKGALPTDTVKNLLSQKGIIATFRQKNKA